MPGNRNLHQADKDLRASALYWPYHCAVDEQIKRLTKEGPPPAFISIHSFTPVLNGESRPWEMGVLWDKDEKTRKIFLEGLREAGYKVGDNEPYSGKAPQDFTIDHHAEENGLPLIDDAVGVAEVAKVMHHIIASIPERLEMKDRRITA